MAIASVKTTVFYLHRRGNPASWLRAFLSSITRNPAGTPYDLVILDKGLRRHGERPLSSDADFNAPPGCSSVRRIAIADAGYDIHAYFTGADEVQTPLVLFFNSHARLMGESWLVAYEAAHAALPQPALVGATASYEPLDEATPFPNAHVRSNGVLIDRLVWLSRECPASDKRACNRFEAGAQGLSRQMLEEGGGIGIVTRQGKLIGVDDWPRAACFRVRQQEELLVADNRTVAYALSSHSQRQRLARLAWGGDALVPRATWVGRFRGWWAWQHGVWAAEL